jgi:hypothetical protein
MVHSEQYFTACLFSETTGQKNIPCFKRDIKIRLTTYQYLYLVALIYLFFNKYTKLSFACIPLCELVYRSKEVGNDHKIGIVCSSWIELANKNLIERPCQTDTGKLHDGNKRLSG